MAVELIVGLILGICLGYVLGMFRIFHYIADQIQKERRSRDVEWKEIEKK